MAESIEVLYQNALLADAAYLDWERLPTDINDDVFKLRMSGLLVSERIFTQEQAQEFVDRYDDLGFQENTPDGFSAINK
tara:strand:+ start:929 stop:1165 length:237 start_codon:yes stop_codon:yes gene_type:complete